MLSSIITALLLFFEAAPHLHFVFEKNKGQAPADVRYLLRTPGYQLDFKRGELVFHFGSESLRVRFTGTLNKLQPEGHARLDGLIRYVDSIDETAPKEEVPKFASVKYESLYSGIDLACYRRSAQLECDFIAMPGANPEQIGVAVEGAQRIEIDETGSVLIQTGGEMLRLRKPNAFQLDHGFKRSIDVRYKLTDPNEISFVIGSYNSSLPLIIDPH